MTRQPDKRNSKMNSIKLKLSALLIALLVLPSCGGSGSISEIFIDPSTKFYGAYQIRSLGSCSDGWAVGVATGYSSASAAASAAVNECRRTGASGCDADVGTFGNAYRNGGECTALSVSRRTGGGCNINSGAGATLSAAKTDTLSSCRGSGRTGCTVKMSACSTSGPADSFYSIVRVGGSNTGGNTSDNRAPAAPTRNYYGAIYSSHNDINNCDRSARAAGISINHLSRSNARTGARNQCIRGGGTDCTRRIDFGSAYTNQCGALAYGETQTHCIFQPGTGNTLSAARSDALLACQSKGFSCSIELSECTD